MAMSRRVLAVVTICILVFLVACESKTVGKRVAIPETSSPKAASSGPTAAAVVQSPTGETGKSAAEVLKELQSSPSAPVASGEKSGTFYPPITTDATGKDALKEKTRALFMQNVSVPNVQADDEFGARYHDNDGDVTNLPDKYKDNSGN